MAFLPKRRHSSLRLSPLGSLAVFWFDLASVHIVLSVLVSPAEVTETKTEADGRGTNEPLSARLSHSDTEMVCEKQLLTCDFFRLSWLATRPLFQGWPGWIPLCSLCFRRTSSEPSLLPTAENSWL